MTYMAVFTLAEHCEYDEARAGYEASIYFTMWVILLTNRF